LKEQAFVQTPSKKTLSLWRGEPTLLLKGYIESKHCPIHIKYFYSELKSLWFSIHNKAMDRHRSGHPQIWKKKPNHFFLQKQHMPKWILIKVNLEKLYCLEFFTINIWAKFSPVLLISAVNLEISDLLSIKENSKLWEAIFTP